MPKQVLPTDSDFDRIKRCLKKLGFKEISRQEFIAQFRRLDLKAPRPRPGREVGFVFEACGLR